jgi:hypothetical protein
MQPLQVVAEDALLLLGGASRRLFEYSFGLDGTRLRRAARSLRSGGDAGEICGEAGPPACAPH